MRLEQLGGHLRSEQSWIGASSYNPRSAAFVPPPPEHVGELLDDLCAFCSTDTLSAATQAALAHAQFETVHPFVDGNGHIGRLNRPGLCGHSFVSQEKRNVHAKEEAMSGCGGWRCSCSRRRDRNRQYLAQSP